MYEKHCLKKKNSKLSNIFYFLSANSLLRENNFFYTFIINFYAFYITIFCVAPFHFYVVNFQCTYIQEFYAIIEFRLFSIPPRLKVLII